MKKTQVQQTSGGGRWAVVIVVLIFLALISFISALIIGVFVSTSEVEEAGNVAHIKIVGPIVSYGTGGLMGGDMAESTEIVRLITKADENPDIQAILLEINSPGGTPVATYEIADAIQKTNKTTVAWIREAGASGAYWVASAADHVIANPMSITGSIGVVASYLEWSGTLQRYNASYQRLVSGNYKDMGTPWKKMTLDEEKIMQENLDLIRDIFIEAVAKNRGLSPDAIDQIADGRFYIGTQALGLGLIDQLGGKDEAVAWIEEKEGIEAELAEYKKPKTLRELLFEAFSEHGFFVGLGIAESFDVEEGVGVRT